MRMRAPIVILVILNLVVLLGQLWPEGAPPFARTVNILFLIANLAFLLFAATRRAQVGSGAQRR